MACQQVVYVTILVSCLQIYISRVYLPYTIKLGNDMLEIMIWLFAVYHIGIKLFSCIKTCLVLGKLEQEALAQCSNFFGETQQMLLHYCNETNMNDCYSCILEYDSIENLGENTWKIIKKCCSWCFVYCNISS